MKREGQEGGLARKSLRPQCGPEKISARLLESPRIEMYPQESCVYPEWPSCPAFAVLSQRLGATLGRWVFANLVIFTTIFLNYVQKDPRFLTNKNKK